MKKILHTESSPGWGGQELRILEEAKGMRKRGHEIFLVVQKGGGLVKPAKEAGFPVEEIDFKKSRALPTVIKLIKIIKKHHIEIINTHSSLDAWFGGIAGRICRKKVIRTRHLSTPIKKGINSLFLYNWLADTVVTTCEEVVPMIQAQANLKSKRCLSIPTGLDLEQVKYQAEEVKRFRQLYCIEPEDCVVGTLCVLRGWKGISDFLQAAKLLQGVKRLKWLIVGSGVSEEIFLKEWRDLGLKETVIFAGHQYPPFVALAAMDIFLLLSWAHEGVSQASLQAAFLEKPLITTPIGGLKEVTLPEKTGLIVPPREPDAVAKAVHRLFLHPEERERMGRAAKSLVLERFTLSHTLDRMEEIYSQ